MYFTNAHNLNPADDYNRPIDLRPTNDIDTARADVQDILDDATQRDMVVCVRLLQRVGDGQLAIMSTHYN